MMDPCKHRNEPSDCIKCWGGVIADQITGSQEGLCSMELPSYFKLL